MNQIQVTDFDGIQGYHKKMDIDGHIYLRPSGIIDSKVKAYFMKLRDTSFVEDLENCFGSTDFLKGVLGNVMWFEVHDDFIGRASTNDERGIWIHFSIAFPLLCMSGTANLRYAALEIQQAMEELVDAKKELRAMSIALSKAHSERSAAQEQLLELSDKNNELEVSLNTFNNIIDEKMEVAAKAVQERAKEMEVRMIAEGVDYDIDKRKAENQATAFKKHIEMSMPNQKWYPLSFINKQFKDNDVTLSDGDTSEYCFSEAFQRAAIAIGYVEKTDKFHFKLLDLSGVARVYRPTRQDKARYNKPGVPVQYFSLSYEGLYHCFDYLVEEGAFNESIVITIFLNI